jgi:hypothetical protein
VISTPSIIAATTPITTSQAVILTLSEVEWEGSLAVAFVLEVATTCQPPVIHSVSF